MREGESAREREREREYEAGWHGKRSKVKLRRENIY
jgi:hypothetical protein